MKKELGCQTARVIRMKHYFYTCIHSDHQKSSIVAKFPEKYSDWPN
jgi:hypothetical protein